MVSRYLTGWKELLDNTTLSMVRPIRSGHIQSCYLVDKLFVGHVRPQDSHSAHLRDPMTAESRLWREVGAASAFPPIALASAGYSTEGDCRKIAFPDPVVVQTKAASATMSAKRPSATTSSEGGRQPCSGRAALASHAARRW